MNGLALGVWALLGQVLAALPTKAAVWLSALALLGTASLLAHAGQPPRDPVDAIQQGADYLEQRTHGLGLGTWGGPIRVDLDLDQTSHQPVRSIWIDRSAFSTQDDPLAGKVLIALTGHIYGSRDEALAAISRTGLTSPTTAIYAYWRDEEGVVVPTTISLTTAPRVTQAACKVLQQELQNARAASAVLLESYLVLAGVRYPLAVKAPSAVGRLIIDEGRALSPAELDIASKLVAEGRVVRVLAESTTRTADFLVDG